MQDTKLLSLIRGGSRATLLVKDFVDLRGRSSLGIIDVGRTLEFVLESNVTLPTFAPKFLPNSCNFLLEPHNTISTKIDR